MRNWHGNLSPFGLWHTETSVAALSVYAVAGFDPDFVLDFEQDYYRTGGSVSTFDDAVTHYREKNATMVDSDGLLKWAPHNLLTYSEDFSAGAWPDRGGVSTSFGVADPFSGASATTITATASSAYIRKFFNAGADSSGRTTTIWVRRRSGTGGIRLYNVGALTTTTIDVTSEWQSFTLSGVYSANYYVGIIINTSGDSVDIYGFHHYRSDLGGMVDNPDQPSGLSTYVPTTSAARYLPRRGNHVYNGTEWVNEGYLHESEVRVNLVTYSNDFTDVSWNASGTSSSLVSVIAPDGSTESTKITEDGTTAVHQFYGQNVSGTSTVVVSGYFKAAEYSTFVLTIGAATNQPYANFDLTTATVSGTGNGGAGFIENVGDGWYRCSLVGTPTVSGSWMIFLTNGNTTSVRAPSYAGDGTSGIYIWGAQLEAGSTPSSYIPTSGATATRSADTITVPSANLPWPTPNVIGPELVTNGTFDSDVSGWTYIGSANATVTQLDGEAVFTSDVGARAQISQGVTTEVGKAYELQFDVTRADDNQSFIEVGTSSGAGDLALLTNLSVGTYSLVFVAQTTTSYIAPSNSTSGATIIFDNISVREIDPLSVSIQMQGRMTVADEGAANTITFNSWASNSNNYIRQHVDTTTVGTATDDSFRFAQANAGTADTVKSLQDTVTFGINVPYNIASRHGSTFINGAVDGTALTADTTPVALPDLSSTNLNLAYDYMGCIRILRMWSVDLGDVGIEEATT